MIESGYFQCFPNDGLSCTCRECVLVLSSIPSQGMLLMAHGFYFMIPVDPKFFLGRTGKWLATRLVGKPMIYDIELNHQVVQP